MLAGTDVYLPPLGGSMQEWVAADTRDPSLVRPYAPDTANAQAYADMRAFRAPIVETHERTYFILLALIAIHIASAVIAEVKEGGGSFRGADGQHVGVSPTCAESTSVACRINDLWKRSALHFGAAVAATIRRLRRRVDRAPRGADAWVARDRVARATPPVRRPVE